MSRVAIAALVAALLGGCYLSHERTGARLDAAVRVLPDGAVHGDAGARRRDSGSARRDGGIAAGTDGEIGEVDADVPLPRDPVDDPGADARPSDDPSASEWQPTPDLDPDEPCCDPIGDPVDIPFTENPQFWAAIAFNGDGWGVLYSGEVTAFQELALDGAPIGPIRYYRDIGPASIRPGLTWAAGRFAAVIEPYAEIDGHSTRMALLDRRGVIDRGWTWPTLLPAGTLYTVAYVDHGDRWVLIAGGDRYAPTDVVELDSSLHRQGSGHAFDRGRALGIAGLKSRVVVFGVRAFGREDELAAAVLSVPLTGITPGSLVLDIPDATDRIVDEAAVTRLRDTAVLVFAPRAGEPGYLASVNPFTNETHVQAYPASLPSPYGDEIVHAATGMDVPGVVATCGNFTTDDRQGIVLRILDASGAQLGEPYAIEESDGARHVYACQVGSQGTTVYVAWPRPWTNAVRVQGFRLRSR